MITRHPSAAVLLALAILSTGPRLCGADAAPEQAPPKVAARTTSVRIVTLKGAWEDHPGAPDLDPFSLMLGDLGKANPFADLLEKIDDFVGDDAIQNVLFDLSSPDLQMNLAQLAELSGHIDHLRSAGKKTFAWLENADTISYSIAAACDTVFMADLGTLDLPSLSLTTLHFKDAMDLLGVRASVVRMGEFKGAVEPFTLSEMSDPLRAHYKAMLKAMNDAIVERIADGRHLERDQVRKLQGERLFTAEAAVKGRLVDQLAPYGAMRDTVAAALGQDVTWLTPPKQAPKQLSFFELIGKLMGGGGAAAAKQPALAILHLDGMIIDGEEERPGLMVSGPIVKAIQELASDKNVRGVVVRINSPGGSATASEAIRQALQKLSAKKPTAISLGEVAASGGYWITCIGKTIYAEPGTITGSIGVFGMKLSVGPLLKRIGINVEHVTLDDSAMAMSLDHDWSAAEQEKIRNLIKDIYQKFLEHVADSRHMKVEAVDQIGGGRVWSGAQAQQNGLVDKIGGLHDALSAVADEAKVGDEFEIIHRPQEKSFFELLDLFNDSEQQIRHSFSSAAVAALQEAGFNLAAPLEMLRQGLAGRAGQVWLLSPVNFVVR